MILSEEQLNQTINFLKTSIVGVQAIYLFGSGVGDDFTPESDVDLAFLAKKPVDRLIIWDLKYALSELVGREIDLIDLSVSNTVLTFQVISTGKLIYQKEENITEPFESRSYNLYLTLNDDRKEILEEVLKSKTIYG